MLGSWLEEFEFLTGGKLARAQLWQIDGESGSVLSRGPDGWQPSPHLHAC